MTNLSAVSPPCNFSFIVCRIVSVACGCPMYSNGRCVLCDCRRAHASPSRLHHTVTPQTAAMPQRENHYLVYRKPLLGIFTRVSAFFIPSSAFHAAPFFHPSGRLLSAETAVHQNNYAEMKGKSGKRKFQAIYAPARLHPSPRHLLPVAVKKSVEISKIVRFIGVLSLVR